MPRSKHPRKAQLPHRLERPRLLPRNIKRHQRRALKRSVPIIRHRLSGRLVAEPIADPIRVAGPDNSLHALLDYVRELGEEGAGVVARCGELLVGRIGAFLVGRFGADGLNYGAGLEVADVCLRWVGVVAWGADVVDVEVSGLGKWAFNVVVADFVGVRAG